MTLKITLKELEALKPCDDCYGAMLAKTFPRKRKFSIADAFAADINQADILWTLYALKSDDVNSKLNIWLASLVKRATAADADAERNTQKSELIELFN